MADRFAGCLKLSNWLDVSKLNENLALAISIKLMDAKEQQFV